MLASFAVGAACRSGYTPPLLDPLPSDTDRRIVMFVSSGRIYCCLLIVSVCCCGIALSLPVHAQSDTRAPTSAGSMTKPVPPLLAEPKSQEASPFLPPIDEDIQYPVAIRGFCVVSLRDQQLWRGGTASYQQMFDGQLYYFASSRESEIFASNASRYVPALAGDCVVTFAELGERVDGNPEYGILHKRRLYFFRSQQEQATFRADPEKFADADLATGGNCLVSRIDDQRKLPGLPETTVIVNGLRYQFAGLHQQRQFLGNMSRYGVERPNNSYKQRGAAFVRRSGARGPVSAKKKPAQAKLASIKNKAMAGYSPVSIRDKGVWVEGSPKYRVEFDGLTYLMVDEAEKDLFQKTPDVYIPALAGHCVVTEIDENRRVKGTIYHAAHHEGEGRLFLFAGPSQKASFNSDPQRYLRADMAAGGLCIVSLLDDREEVQGLPEFMVWHKGKRYFFASAEKKADFFERIELYQEQ